VHKTTFTCITYGFLFAIEIIPGQVPMERRSLYFTETWPNIFFSYLSILLSNRLRVIVKCFSCSVHIPLFLSSLLVLHELDLCKSVVHNNRLTVPLHPSHKTDQFLSHIHVTSPLMIFHILYDRVILINNDKHLEMIQRRSYASFSCQKSTF